MQNFAGLNDIIEGTYGERGMLIKRDATIVNTATNLLVKRGKRDKK